MSNKTWKKLITVQTHSRVLVQGTFVESLSDGRVVVLVDGKEVTGKPVERV